MPSFIKLSEIVINTDKINEIIINYKNREYFIMLSYRTNDPIIISKINNKYDYYTIKNWIHENGFRDAHD